MDAEVTPSTIIKDEISVGNWLGTFKARDLHLNDYINLDNTILRAIWGSSNIIQLAIVPIDIQVDFDYEVDTIATFKGHGNAKGNGIGLIVSAALKVDSSGITTVWLN